MVHFQILSLQGVFHSFQTGWCLYYLSERFHSLQEGSRLGGAAVDQKLPERSLKDQEHNMNQLMTRLSCFMAVAVFSKYRVSQKRLEMN